MRAACVARPCAKAANAPCAGGFFYAGFAPPAPLPISAAEPAAPTWAFEPARDRFESAALLDLRHLNEGVAGQSGFVRVDGRGGFLRGDGQPIRFWAVNTGLAPRAGVVPGPVEVAGYAEPSLVFALAALSASVRHRDLFDFNRVAPWIWFGGLLLIAAVLTVRGVVPQLRRLT